MSYFDHEFFGFLEELAKNNNTDWFHANKKRYDESVKEPFRALVEEMIFMIRAQDPDLDTTPAQAIFRINRDIRFSKDKSPYKTHMAAAIQNGGRKTGNSPGFYFHLSPASVSVGGGAHHLDKDGLYRIRQTIAASPDTFAHLYRERDFLAKYGQIKGEKNKRLPKEFQEVLEHEPLIANKQFFYMATLNPKIILRADLPDLLMEYYSAAEGLRGFLKHALAN